MLGGENEIDSELQICFSSERERERDFSLDLRAIRPLEFVGTRSKAALCIKTYAWASVSGVFDKLREVGVSPYLSFTLCLSVFMMLELFEALNGHLIGPKTWDRIIENFRNPNGQPVTVHGLFGLVMVKCVL